MPLHSHQKESNEPDWNDDESTLNGSYTGSRSSEWNGIIYGLQAIGHGTAGIVFALDDVRVVKVYGGQDNRSLGDYETERQAYQNLRNGSLNVLKCFGLQNPDGLVLERCQRTLRNRLKSPCGDYSPQNEALDYAIQAARGLTYVHKCGIIQGDGKALLPSMCIEKTLIDVVGCHNMLLDRGGILKIADFAGSSVENSRFPASVNYEVGSKLPVNSMPSVKSDIFAFGSAIYEMINRKPPFKGERYAEVQRRFRKGIFPEDFEPCPALEPIVKKCWGIDYHKYRNMEEVYDDLCRLSGYASSSSEIPKTVSSARRLHRTSNGRTEPRLETGPAESLVVQKSLMKDRRRKEKTYVDLHTKKQKPRPHYEKPSRDTLLGSRRKKTNGNMFSQLIDSFHLLTFPHRQSSTLQARSRAYR